MQIAIVGLFWLTLAAAAQAETYQGRATITDGDTLEVQGVTVRLQGIDAAESGQRCVASGRQIVRPGKDAMLRLENLARNGITCSGTSYDDFGRLIGHCTGHDGTDINKALVTEGWAWAFTKYSNDYVAEQARAKRAHLGVWAMACEEPWVFRKKRWEVAGQKAPKGCAIKGNVSENGKVYHLPWNKSYAKTKVDLKRGERWFCDEKQALAAGWRPARN